MYTQDEQDRGPALSQVPLCEEEAVTAYMRDSHGWSLAKCVDLQTGGRQRSGLPVPVRLAAPVHNGRKNNAGPNGLEAFEEVDEDEGPHDIIGGGDDEDAEP